MLKYKADFKTVIYLLLMPTILFVMWQFGETMPWVIWVPVWLTLMFFSVSAAIIAHNHNHLNMWHSKLLNRITDLWITVFYGFPIFAWIPTHNANHHKYVNKAEDDTRTYRVSEKNNLFTILTYPSLSGTWQQKRVFKYYIDIYKRNKTKFWQYTLQFTTLVAWLAIFLTLDWQKALIYVVIPQQFSLFSVLMFNYIQHIHTDEESKYNNSRNIVGSLNWFLLNNGLHTAHHMHPATHWSELPALHETIKDKIDPSLNEPSFWGYLFKTYVLSIFMPKYRSQCMRAKRLAAQAAN